jgi:hypothetical protein
MRFARTIRALPPIAVLALVSCAHAAGVNLGWDECVGGGGSMFRDFSCDTDVGTQVLVASVVAPAGIDQLVSFETEIQISPTGAVFPDWWRLRNQTGQVNQCRNGALTSSADFNGWTGCTDVYLGQAAGGITTYLVDASGANFARLHVTYSLPSDLAAVLVPEQEYYATRISISNAKTIGPDACSGCSTPACITCSYVRCLQPAGSPGGNVTVTYGNFNTVGWHPVAWSDCGCSAAPQKVAGPNTCSVVCPVRNATWGQLKSLYR